MNDKSAEKAVEYYARIQELTREVRGLQEDNGILRAKVENRNVAFLALFLIGLIWFMF